jgi:hypothetical protein
VFVYTREAHPGEEVPEHESLDRKLDCARLLRDETGIRRLILVDDLAGTVHHRYGLMPNMTWVIGQDGRVAYKANWTSAANVEAFLGRFLAASSDGPPGTPVPYETEQLEIRRVNRDEFMTRLARNGPRAVTEFRTAMRLWGQRS